MIHKLVNHVVMHLLNMKKKLICMVGGFDLLSFFIVRGYVMRERERERERGNALFRVFSF